MSLLAGCGAAGAGAPSAAVTASSAPLQTPSPLPLEDQPAPPGRYTMLSDGYRYTFTVATPGWRSIAPDWGVRIGDAENDPPDLAAFAAWGNPRFVYLDPCRWFGEERTTGTTAEEWLAAITEVDELDPSEPTDITVGGHPGKRIRITASSAVAPENCTEGEYRPYEGRTHLGATQSDELWIVELPGGDRRVLVTSFFPDTPERLRDELEQLLASMTIAKE